jgi:hypothetical protein
MHARAGRCGEREKWESVAPLVSWPDKGLTRLVRTRAFKSPGLCCILRRTGRKWGAHPPTQPCRS